MPARPARDTSETRKTKKRVSCELAFLSRVDLSCIAEPTGATDETTPQPEDDTHDTKQVAFAADKDNEAIEHVHRRATSFVRETPRDSASEMDPETTAPSSLPEEECYPETDVSAPAEAEVKATASPEVAKTSSHPSPRPDRGSIERKSVDISNQVSALLPSLPDDVIDDTIHTGEKCRPRFYMTAPESAPTLASPDAEVMLDTPPAEQVPILPISDTDAGQDVEPEPEPFPLSADIPEDEDEEDQRNVYPDTLPESLDEPLPTKSDKDENEIENMEKQSDAASFCSKAAKVNGIDDKMSTLEPQRHMPEVVYVSLHEEKQTKDTNRVASDTEKSDADIERKSVLANYGLQRDDNRKKSVIDRVIQAPPPTVSESGIALTLSHYDNDDVEVKTKIRMSEDAHSDDSQPKTRTTKVEPLSTSFARTLTMAGKKLGSYAKDKTVAGDDAKSDKIKRFFEKRKPTFVEELMAETQRRRPSAATFKEAPVDEQEPELPEPEPDSTLIVALNKAAECELEDYRHVASRPSSLLYRYIVSPNAQYVGGRSKSKTSVYQPVQCELRPSTAGAEKQQKGTIVSLTDAQASVITSMTPTESSYTRLGSTAPEVLPASASTDDSNIKTDTLPGDRRTKPSVRLSVDAPIEIISPAEEAVPTYVPAHHEKPVVGELINVPLADFDRDEETVARRVSWPKSTLPYSSNRNNQTRVLPQLPSASDPVETNYAADVASPVQPSPPEVRKHQRSSPDDVISFTLDSYDSYDDRNMAHPAITGQNVKFNAGSHNANIETEDMHVGNASVSSVQSMTNSGCNIPIQSKHQASYELVKTEFRISSKCETENVHEHNLMQVPPSSVADAGRLRMHDTAAYVCRSSTSEFAQSDSCNVGILKREKSEENKTRKVNDREECSSMTSRWMSKIKSSKLRIFLAKLIRKKGKRKNN